jgi:hypothetical protein
VNVDTNGENSYIKLCLEHGACRYYGGPLSLGPLVTGASWSVLKTFLVWAGVYLDRLHFFLLALDAAGLVMVAVSGSILGGRLLGIAAMAAVFGMSQPHADMVVNLRFTFFPSCVLLALCISAAARNSLPLLLCASAAASVTVNSYLPSLTAALAPPLCALFVREDRRVRTFLVTGAASIVSLFILAPGLWISYAWLGLTGDLFQSGMFAGQNPDFRLSFITKCCVGGGAAALAAFLLRPPGDAFKRSSLALAAILVPGIAVYLAVASRISHTLNDTYIKHILPAAGASLAALGWVVWYRLHRLWLRIFGARKLVPDAVLTIISVTVRAAGICAAFLAMVFWLQTPGRERLNPDAFTNSDMEKVRGLLQDKYRWSMAMVYRHLRGLRADDIIYHLLLTTRKPAPEDPRLSAGIDVLVFKTDRERLPEMIPQGWHVFRPDRWTQKGLLNRDLVVIPYRTRIQWDSFLVCDASGAAGGGCRESGLHYRPFSPAMGSVHQINRELIDVTSNSRHVLLKYRLRPAEPDVRYEFFPYNPEGIPPGCVESALRVEGDGNDQVLVNEWRNCTAVLGRHLVNPPFFLEGPERIVEALRLIIFERDFNDAKRKAVTGLLEGAGGGQAGVEEDLLKSAAEIEAATVRNAESPNGQFEVGTSFMERMNLPRFLFAFPSKWFAIAFGAAELAFLLTCIAVCLALHLRNGGAGTPAPAGKA